MRCAIALYRHMPEGTSHTELRLQREGKVLFYAQISASVAIAALRPSSGDPSDVVDVILRVQDGWQKADIENVSKLLGAGSRKVGSNIVKLVGFPEKMRTKTIEASTVCIHAVQLSVGDHCFSARPAEQVDCERAALPTRYIKRNKKIRGARNENRFSRFTQLCFVHLEATKSYQKEQG